MSETLHTPTPWSARPTGQVFKYNILIAQFNSRWNAAFARDAVNAHDDLVAALEAARQFVPTHGTLAEERINMMVESALKKAKGPQ